MPRIVFATALKLLLIFTLGAVVITVTLALAFPGHWRVVALEQMVLAPWLRPAYLGDGGPASALLLCNPMGLTLNRGGELLISDRGRARRGRVVWRIDGDGNAHIVAGTGLRGTSGAHMARALSFDRPEGLAVAGDGSLYVSDGYHHAVYRIDGDETVTRVAGTGAPGFSGDGGPATLAMLFRPAEIALDSKGNLFIADVRNHRVRRLDTSGRITTVAGTGRQAFSPDGTRAELAHLDTPWGLAIDDEDRLIIADSANHRVRRVEHDGSLLTIAGNGLQGFSGDGGSAVAARLNWPEALFVDAIGRVVIGDELNHAVRIVDQSGRISTLIGTGTAGRGTIGEAAHHFAIDQPEGVVVMPSGDLVVSDGENGRVLRRTAAGIVQLVAGRGDTASCVRRW